jgi:hypothetical protein
MGLASPPVPNPRPVQRASQVCLLGRRYRLSSRLGVALRRNRFSQRRNLDETIGCYRSCLKLCRSDMELGTFEKGYIAGWRSVRGPKDLPPNVPASPMRIPAGSLHGRLLSRPKRRDCHGRDPRFGKLECPRGWWRHQDSDLWARIIAWLSGPEAAVGQETDCVSRRPPLSGPSGASQSAAAESLDPCH